MSRATIARTAITVTGLNLTDLSMTVMATGAGNGVQGPAHQGDVLVLTNPTGGNAAYTIKVAQPAGLAARGAVVADVTVTVATLKTWLYPLTDTVFRQTDGNIYVDCDVAGKISILATGA